MALEHAFATSPWLGAIVVALIVLVSVVLALIKKAGRVLDDTPGLCGGPCSRPPASG